MGMVGTKRNRADEDTDETLGKNKDAKDKSIASLRNSLNKQEKAKIQDTETKIAHELNGVDSNEDSDDSGSSVYSELEDEDDSSQDENESEEMSTNDDEDTDQSGDNDTEEENKENESSTQKIRTE